MFPKIKPIWFFVLFFTCFSKAQTINDSIYLTEKQTEEISSLLEKYHSRNGKCSEIEIGYAYLSTFIEMGDYGPMYYGDTLNVNQDGILIRYKFDSIDSNNEISSNKNWHSIEQKFLPKDRSAIYSKYRCSFGVPSSHGFSNKKRKWDGLFDEILSIIGK